MDRPSMPPALSPNYATEALASHPYAYESDLLRDTHSVPGGDDIVGKSLNDYGGGGGNAKKNPSFPCLYPGCEIRCLDEVVLNRHVETHFANTCNSAGTGVLGQHQYVANNTVPDQHGPPVLYERSPNLDLTSPSLGTPTDEICEDPKHPKDKFYCGHGICSKTFTRAADLERHAKSHQSGPKEHECPAPGCPREGTKGFTRKDKLADHWKCKHLGVLGDMRAWML